MRADATKTREMVTGRQPFGSSELPVRLAQPLSRVAASVHEFVLFLQFQNYHYNRLRNPCKPICGSRFRCVASREYKMAALENSAAAFFDPRN